MTLVVCREHNKPSTRGFIVYKDDRFDEKTFTFTTEPLFTQVAHLQGSSLLRSSAFHFLDLPQSLGQKIEQLKAARRDAGMSGAPKLIWEPKPSACQMSQLQDHLQACKLVEVFSPNHIELQSLVEGNSVGEFRRNNIERCAKRLIDSGISPNSNGVALVRYGEHGSLICRRGQAPAWYPPYHTSSSQVIDATGTGNSFLGGFITGVNQSSGDLVEAVGHSTVAASLVIEQFGLPVLNQAGNSKTWNGVNVAARLREYRNRVRN